MSSSAWINDSLYSFGKFTVQADSAKTLSINFDDFFLPQTAELFIYNRDGLMIMGPITSSENNKNKIWGSSIFKGDILNIEVKVNTQELSQLKLNISNVAYGYKQLFVEKTIGFGISGSCNINVLCPLGNGWDNERNSVALITNSDGSALCTGALLANTLNTNTPYLLTANHCYSASPGVSGWRFQFQAWSPSCTPSTNSSGVLFNGSTLRANYAPSDFALVELNSTPSVSSGITYSGWNRGTTTASSTTGIHHPRGDVMKISRDISAPSKSGYLGASGSSHWQVSWDNGVTEGGSSGSPLYDQNHRVIGQLHGGYSSCTSSDLRDWYGSFDQSWTGGGTNSTRLSNWLDPNSTGAVTTNSVGISCLASGPLTISGNDQICSGSLNYYTLTNPPTGASVMWSTTGGISISGSNTSNPVAVGMTSTGQGTLTGTVVTGCYTYALTKIIHTGLPVFPIVSLNPACANETGILTFNLPPGQIISSATGFQGGVNVPLIEVSPTQFELPPDVFKVTLTIQNSCGTVTVSKLIPRASCGALISVYPNPANNEVTVELNNQSKSLKKSQEIKSSTNKEIKLYNAKGDYIKSIKINGNKTIINTSNIPSGAYYLKIIDDAQTITKPFIIVQ